MSFILRKVLVLLLTICLGSAVLAYTPTQARHMEQKQQQKRQDDGYIGYKLEQRGDPDSTLYETADTTQGLVLPETPDVYLSANVSVGEIDIEVDNITAKINLNVQVLSLLNFNAGVDASIDRVKLTIQNVSASVLLEARLGNVVQMVDDVLSSIDLNPIIATLGNTVTSIVNSTAGVVSGTASDTATTTAKRDLSDAVLYSINDYSGNTHTNRILGQDGNLYDVKLDNDGNEVSSTEVGNYATSMSFDGHNKTISVDGEVKEFELQYTYIPFPGIDVVSWIYVSPAGKVTRTQIIAEAAGGGMSTISDDSDDL